MKNIFRKGITLIITLLFISIFVFIAFELIPGDRAITALGTEATKEAVEALREEMGLNKGIVERFFIYVQGAVKGDFGMSTQFKMPVKELIKDRLLVTIYLSILSIFFIIICSIPIGIVAGQLKNNLFGKCLTIITHICMAIPSFFLGILLTLLFGFVLKWFSLGSYVSPKEDIIAFLQYLIYPAIAIAIPKIAMTVKFLRTSIIKEWKQDYVRTALSKGNLKQRVLYCHILKNAFIPVITFLGLIIVDVLAGSIIIEQVFSLPGLGRLLIVAISNRDFAVVQAIVLYIATIVMVINCIIDLLYQYLDPRIKR